jgi:hypothetical protein
MGGWGGWVGGGGRKYEKAGGTSEVRGKRRVTQIQTHKKTVCVYIFCIHTDYQYKQVMYIIHTHTHTQTRTHTHVHEKISIRVAKAYM